MDNLTTPQPNIPDKPTDVTVQDFKINTINQQLKYPLDHITVQALKEALGLNNQTSGQMPIGSIYSNKTNSSNPSSYLGYGTWTAIEGVVIAGYKSGDANFGTAGTEIGSATHTLTIPEMPSHDHASNYTSGSSSAYAFATVAGNSALTVSGSTGGDQPHNNIQPTLVAYVWERTA